ncbi:HAD family hydrolase [Pseudomonas sp. GCM10022188]|uniref:HAD family hydrolase n=1 Tax=Pseudomonas TaxID=286 RepID=UPI001E5D0A4C|nr:HAD-IA family hydrolase [Pseudomonas oryzagri]MCC6076902.1 HAD-IA family hydrolase [Pseudomonas oryzagri]
MRYRNYIFDCDGVLLDSNNFKLTAMRLALSGYSENLVDTFIEYFRNNFGKSRYHHITVFFDEFLKRESLPDEKQQILDLYAQKCREQYLECNVCEGVFELLEAIPSTNCWIVSGSDQDELREVFRARGLENYFVEIYGSPTRKSINIQNIIESSNLIKSETCLIGDAEGDRQAAEENGIDFIFCSGYSNTPELAANYSNQGYRVVESLLQIITEKQS